MFLIINGCTVLFMQCGFALLEAGAVRAKNVTNILMKNFLDACKFISENVLNTRSSEMAGNTETPQSPERNRGRH